MKASEFARLLAEAPVGIRCERRSSLRARLLQLLRFLRQGAAAAGIALAPTVAAAAAAVPPPAAIVPAVAALPTQAVVRPAWLERLTLGPGDRVNLALLDSPELAAAEVPIGPDGRLGFLEAQEVVAAGLTIDELRQRLDEELGRFRRAPRTIVTPASFQSKKYYLLGQIAGPGVFTMDRPITVIEAIARARGLTMGFERGRMTEQADLSRSFLMRQGRRIPINFEQLFLRGDLSQNVTLEPGDYLYFPPAEEGGVYVLGEVRMAGLTPAATDLSILQAISIRGGFTDRAWKGRVLVVRGSLNQPQTFEIDLNDILSGRRADMRLQPRDIIYVSSRPWVKVGEIIDAAATAFIQAAIIVSTNEFIYNR